MTGNDLADVVRKALTDLGAQKIREVKMFGGIGFMLNGNLLVGASGRGLLVRVGKDAQPEALKRRGARPMVMRGRTMEGYVYVDPPELATRTVKTWVDLSIRFVRTLPAKS
jgi:TfoX/Sxy family transcriptional regulator of competence genes